MKKRKRQERKRRDRDGGMTWAAQRGVPVG